MRNIITVNQIRKIGNERVRILSKIKTTSDKFAVISLDNPQAWPEIKSAKALLNAELLEKESLIRVPDFESKEFLEADKRLTTLKPILDLMDLAYDKFERGKAIRDVCRNNEVSENTVRTWLRRYWQSGCTATGLIRLTVETRATRKNKIPRGAKAKNRKTFLMTSEVKEAMKAHISKAIFGRKLGVAAAFRNFVSEYFPHRNIAALKNGEIPSQRQYRYVYITQFTKEERLRREHGFKGMQLTNKTSYGNAKESVSSALQVYEIDSTPGETELGSMINRAIPVGKPYVYYIKDRGTSFKAGFYISFDSPSWAVVKEAILSLACCKKTLCEKYGVEYDPNDWPADCLLPSEFIGDLGPEMTSTESNALTETLRCTFTNTSRQDGPAKGTVESAFNGNQQLVEAGLPGHRKDKNRGERQKGKADKESALNIYEYTALILRHFINSNRAVLSATKPVARFIEAGVPYVPIEMFNHDLNNVLGIARETTLEELQTSLMPRTTAKSTSKGLNVKGVFYMPEDSDGISDKFTQHRHQTGDADVTVLYDSNNIDTVWAMLDGQNGPLTKMKTCGGFEHFSGYSFREINLILESQRELNESKKAEKQLAQYDLEELKSVISAKAILEKKIHQKEMEKEQKRSKLEARNEEAREHRRSAHSTASTGNRFKPTVIIEANEPSEQLSSNQTSVNKTNSIATTLGDEIDYASWE